MDSRLDLFLVRPPHHEPIHQRVHVFDLRLVQIQFLREVYGLAVHDQSPAALLAQFVEDEIQLLTVHLEHRRPHLHLRPFGQRKDGLENLAGRAARRRLAAAGAVRFADGGKQQVQIAGDVGHGADRRAWVVDDGLLVDGDHRR